MTEDDLSIADIEHAVLAAQLVEVQKGDPKGNRYVLEGLGAAAQRR
jgi:hypothetical protein